MNEDTEKFIEENEESRASGKPLAGASKQDDLTYRIIGVDLGEMIVDLVVEGQVIVELKAARVPGSVTESQVIGYLKAAGLKRGLVINFNVRSLKSGIKRFSV